jgi:hypothetical protein
MITISNTAIKNDKGYTDNTPFKNQPLCIHDKIYSKGRKRTGQAHLAI